MWTPCRLVGTGLVLTTSLAVTIAAQQPRITNGRVATQPAGAPFAQTFRTLVSNQADVAWFGYAVPVVDGERVMCCFGNDTTWVNGNVVMSDGSSCCRACRLEPSADGTSMATRAPGTAGAEIAMTSFTFGNARMIVCVSANALSRWSSLGRIVARFRFG